VTIFSTARIKSTFKYLYGGSKFNEAESDENDDGRGGHDEKYLHNKFRSISVSLLNSTSISVPTIE